MKLEFSKAEAMKALVGELSCVKSSLRDFGLDLI